MDGGTLLGSACLALLAVVSFSAAASACDDEMPGAGLAMLGVALVLCWLAAGAFMHGLGA